MWFTYKDRAYLKMCVSDFGDMRSTRSPGAQSSCFPIESSLNSASPSDSPRSPDYKPNQLGTLDHDGNADSNRSGGKRFLGKIANL